MMAAPVCSQVLIRNSESNLDVTPLIDDLAQLRMELDLAQTSGQQSMATKVLAESLERKLGELSKKLQNQYTSKQIKMLIVDRIQEIQKNRGDEQKKDSEERANSEAKLVAPFKLKKQIVIDDYSMGLFEYLPDLNSIVVQSYKNKSLVLYNLQTGAKNVLHEESQVAYFSRELNQIFSISNSGQLLRIDATKGKIISRVNTGLTGLRGKIAVDDKYSRLLVQSATQGFIINISKVKNGRYDSAAIINFKGGGPVEQMVFASDGEILFTHLNRLLTMDLDTKQIQQINTQQDIYSIELSADRKFLLWTSSPADPQGSGIVPLEKVHQFTAVSRRFPNEVGQVKFGFKPDEIYMDFKTHRAIYKIGDLETPIYTFERAAGFDKNIYSLAPMFATEKLFFTREHINDPFNRTGAVILEVWEK